MPGLGTSFGRGGATVWVPDLVNADCILIEGSNFAEAHPVAYRFVMQAKERGATIIHVDPRFTRTSALSDVYVGIRAGSDIAFLGGLINYVLTHERWFPDYVLRLFRRGKARFSDDLVHERVICGGPIARLNGQLAHCSVTRLEEAISRIDRYSTAGAAMLVASGRRVSFARGITHGLWTFFRVYVLRLGFLDGREGFLLAVANAEGTYYRYMKAWLAGRRHG